MADDNTGADDTKNTSDGNDAPFKAFKTEDEFKQFESKMFSSGYNNYQEKALGRIGKALGGEFESLDDVESQITELKQKVSSGIDDPTATEEYKSLQSKYGDLQKQVEKLGQEKQTIQTQYSVDSKIGEGLSAVKATHELKIDESDVKQLFKTKHKVESVDGRLVAKQYDEAIGDFKPVMDDNGAYKPVDQVFADFAKNYAAPNKKGTGGETGGEAGQTKVKRSEYAKALKTDAEKAAKLFEQGQTNGWVDDLIPQ